MFKSHIRIIYKLALAVISLSFLSTNLPAQTLIKKPAKVRLINQAEHKKGIQGDKKQNTNIAPSLIGVQITRNNLKNDLLYSFSQKPEKIVVEKLSNNRLQIRIKPAYLGKNLFNKSVNRTTVTNRIERGNVLVSEIRLGYPLANYNIFRKDNKISVLIKETYNTNGEQNSAKSAAKGIADKSTKGTKSSIAKGNAPKTVQTKSKTTQANDVKIKFASEKVEELKPRKVSGKYTIVIDPGHGGEDPGTISQEDLIMEKTITLSVGRLLEKELKRLVPNGKIIITRNSDKYITLADRSRMANRNNAKLFVSLHCNAAVENPENAHGFECYIYREKLEVSTGEVAENNIMQKENMENKLFGAEALLARSLTYKVAESQQPKQIPNSWQLANWITKGLDKGTSIKNRGIHKAHFYVLAGTNMPAVLVEMGYITHEKDRAKMNSITGQKQISKSVAYGIINYLLNTK